MRAPVPIDEQELCVTASIGVAVYPFDGQERDLLLRHADAALYRAKARGRNRFELFDHGLAAQAAARVSARRRPAPRLAQDELCAGLSAADQSADGPGRSDSRR